jgi:CheY-like chemotaxis protein
VTPRQLPQFQDLSTSEEKDILLIRMGFPIEENEARLGQVAVPCAAWSQGTIALGQQATYIQSGTWIFEAGADLMSPEPEFICIVDDDASVRNSIEQLLDSEGLKAQSFEDPEEFLAYARSHAVPLALLDVWMPKMSGLEVQKQLQVVSPNTKVIVVTAREIPAIRVAALEAGAFAFLMKPFEDDAFLSLVQQALRPAT